MSDTQIVLPYWQQQILQDKQHDRFIITGGLGCLRGDVKIRTENGLIPISELSEPMFVQSWNDQTNQFQLSLASASFRKGRGYLFEVITKQGKFVANGYHQMLCGDGIYRLVETLNPGDVLSCFDTLHPTSSGISPLRSLLNGRRYKSKALGSLGRCVALFRQYGRQLLSALNIDRFLIPLQADAQKSSHMFDLCEFLQTDGRGGRSLEHIQAGQSYDQKQKQGYVSRTLGLVVILASLVSTSSFEHTSSAILVFLLFLLMFLLRRKVESLGLCRVLLSCGGCSLSNTTIVSIKQIESNDYYWDLQVLDTNNYVTEDGTIHHNSGKSSGSAIVFILNMLQNAHEKMWWACTLTHSRIDDSLLPSFIFALDLLGRKANTHYQLLKSKPATITIFETMQTVRFLSADRPELMVSATIGGYLLSEGFQTKREVYENLESRTRSKKVRRTIGIVEGTPEGDRWSKDEFNIDKSDPKRKMRRFILTTYDNEHNLSSDYIPRLHQIYAHSPAMIKSYIYGEFSSFRLGDVFAQYLESRNVIPQIKPDPFRSIALCFDFNATPLTWSAWQTVPYKIGSRFRAREICIAESSLDCKDLFAAALEVGKIFDPSIFANTPIELWGDRTGHAKSHKTSGTDFSNLRDYLAEVYNNITIKAPREVTPIRASVDVFNRLLLYELILICDNCKNMRRSLNMVKWNKATDDLEKKAGETHTHHSDGARYRIWKLYKSVNVDNILDSGVITGVNA